MRICPECLEKYEQQPLHCEKDGAYLLPIGTGDPRLGTVAGDRFLILDVLGKGGMSTIYRAYQLSMERAVALKLLSGQDLRDPDVVERFMREARQPAHLRSPHTIQLYDFGRLETGELFIAMELISGRSLDALIAEEAPIDPKRAVSLLVQVCIALEEAHAHDLVHRDIKPSNIMVERVNGRTEHVKVLDFGLVKLIGQMRDQQAALTHTGTFFGTPPYMAPEQWNTERGEVGPHTDIYALGVMAHQMLTGKRPIAANNPAAFMYAHLFEAPAALGAHVPLDAELARLEGIVLRCLEKRPEDRYRSVAELRRELLGEDAVVEEPREKEDGAPPPIGGEPTLPPAPPPIGGEPTLPPAPPPIFGSTGLNPRAIVDPPPPIVVPRRSHRALALLLVAGLGSSASFFAARAVDELLDRGRGERIGRGAIEVSSNPAGAFVLVDGQPTGLFTPVALRGLPAGSSISVSLQKDGRTTAPRTARAARDEDVRLDIDLSRSD